MADKQLNINLAFTADTAAAKRQLQDLQQSLTSLVQSSSTKTSKLGLTDEIQEAITAVTDLQSKLQQATNVNTGKLDLGQFNQSLKQSNTSLEQYADALATLGPTGKQAFSEVANAIATAEMPLKRTNSLLAEFAVTLKNTAKWEISSKIMHGFESAISSAYNYAQDLNESLNNIRIVTGYDADKMADFAESANKAAKALSTTTLDYTDASLIYYQQGNGQFLNFFVDKNFLIFIFPFL